MYIKLNVWSKFINKEGILCILILDDKIEKFKEIARSYTKWQTREEKENTIILTKDLELHIIELPKALEEYKIKPQDKVMQWMKFIENPNDGEVKSIMKENKDIKEAKEKLDELSQDEELKRLAFLREKGRRDYADGIYYATRKGEKQAKIEVIKRLHKMGLNIEEIANAVDMSEEKIKEYI